MQLSIQAARNIYDAQGLASAHGHQHIAIRYGLCRPVGTWNTYTVLSFAQKEATFLPLGSNTAAVIGPSCPAARDS